jgi:uridine kinase
VDFTFAKNKTMFHPSTLDLLTDRLSQLSLPHPLRVAIDGIDAAGKTTLAGELALCLERSGRPVIRASLDGFHRPRLERYRRGPDSPEGYYHDSFDYEALKTALLLPLGPGGDCRYRTAVFDYRTDQPLDLPLLQAPPHTILLVDGIFLLRPELAPLWDYRIFISLPFEVALERALQRDMQAESGKTQAELRARYLQRYLPAQRYYLKTVKPQDLADMIIDNNETAS